MRKLGPVPFAVAAMLLAPVVCRAEAAPLPGPLSEVIACTRIADGPARLACMDKSVAALQAAAGSGELVIQERGQIRRAQRETFGLGRRSETPAGEPDLTQATFDVVAAGHAADGHWIVVLQDAGTWRLTDNEMLARDPRPGSKVKISKGALGRFFVEIDGQPKLSAARLH